MEQIKNKQENGKISQKNDFKYGNFTKYFTIALVLLLLASLIYSQWQYQLLVKSIGGLNQTYNEVQMENKDLKEQIEEQNHKLWVIGNQIHNYLEDSITKEEFTEIYNQLQELEEKVSDVNKTVSYINRIKGIVSSNNKQLKGETVSKIAKYIYETAQNYEFNPFLICALIKVESNFKVDSVSSASAYGLCQVSRPTARKLAPHLGINWDGAEETLLNPEKNIKIGIHYLSSLYNDFGDLKLALTAYNYGPGRVQGFISQDVRIPSGYTDKVLKYYAQYEGLSRDELNNSLTLKWGNS